MQFETPHKEYIKKEQKHTYASKPSSKQYNKELKINEID